ncbi:pyridoxal-phosphate dependent enzyme [Candidatus Sumerlaeota bacterium]|nr:pyridoxal-phosphate dependent enzyme [Candidatus Sumerlaeota bacterium]
MIDLSTHEDRLAQNVVRARERGILIPTFEQMIDPSKIPATIREKLREVGLWDVNPLNLFRVTWHNDPKAKGGGFGGVNFMEIPREITGVQARIFGLVGKWFPTGAHKVGAAIACLAPRLVTGQFDASQQRAVWPSTGNYCRGGAYVSALLACESIAILPEEMSRERFEWLATVAGEVIATPGCESNVKEIYDKCWELRKTRGDDIMIFNQFDEFGNYLWHHEVTGRAIEEVLGQVMGPRDRFAGVFSSTGSAGTIACGDYLKRIFPASKIAAGEALQCPTLLENGFGGHRIEGIGDKHVPWIHNVRNTDLIIAIDDEATVRAMRVFNEPVGREHLKKCGADPAVVDQLGLLGISGIGNLLGAVKMAKWYELDERDVVVTILTDSMELYGSRIAELREELGEYTATDAAVDHQRWLLGQGTDNMLELRHSDRRRIHNLKYFTWIEQQGRELDELNAQWEDRDYWDNIVALRGELDRRIEEFNARVNA